MLKKTMKMSLCVLVLGSISIQALAQGTALKTYASFSYLYQQKNQMTGVFDFVNDIWVSNESNLVTVNFTNSDTAESRTLAGIAITVYDKKGVSLTYSTTDVPPIVNPYPDQNSGEYKHWWSVIGFAGLTKKEIVFTMWDYAAGVRDDILLVSYTMDKKTQSLVRNHTVTVSTVNDSGITTKLRRAWSAKNSIYYVVSSTDNISGATISSIINVYDAKLAKLKKQMNNPHPGDLTYGERGGNNSMFPMPPGFIFDDYSTTDPTGEQIIRNIHIYKQP